MENVQNNIEAGIPVINAMMSGFVQERLNGIHANNLQTVAPDAEIHNNSDRRTSGIILQRRLSLSTVRNTILRSHSTQANVTQLSRYTSINGNQTNIHIQLPLRNTINALYRHLGNFNNMVITHLQSEQSNSSNSNISAEVNNSNNILRARNNNNNINRVTNNDTLNISTNINNHNNYTVINNSSNSFDRQSRKINLNNHNQPPPIRTNEDIVVTDDSDVDMNSAPSTSRNIVRNENVIGMQDTFHSRENHSPIVVTSAFREDSHQNTQRSALRDTRHFNTNYSPARYSNRRYSQPYSNTRDSENQPTMNVNNDENSLRSSTEVGSINRSESRMAHSAPRNHTTEFPTSTTSGCMGSNCTCPFIDHRSLTAPDENLLTRPNRINNSESSRHQNPHTTSTHLTHALFTNLMNTDFIPTRSVNVMSSLNPDTTNSATYSNEELAINENIENIHRTNSLIMSNNTVTDNATNNNNQYIPTNGRVALRRSSRMRNNNNNNNNILPNLNNNSSFSNNMNNPIVSPTDRNTNSNNSNFTGLQNNLSNNNGSNSNNEIPITTDNNINNNYNTNGHNNISIEKDNTNVIFKSKETPAIGKRKVTEHGGLLRTFIVHFNFKFENLLDSIFLRVVRAEVIRTTNRPMADFVTIYTENGKYLITEQTERGYEKLKSFFDYQKSKGSFTMQSNLKISVLHNRYLITHIRPVKSNFPQNNTAVPGLWSFRTFTQASSAPTHEATSPGQTHIQMQLQQLLFYQMQQQMRDRMEQEQFRNRFENQQIIADQQQSGSEDAHQGFISTSRQRVLSPAQHRAYYRTFMEMNASTVRFIDLLTEKEYKIKMSNENINTMREAYFKLDEDQEYLYSSHYGHRLIRKAYDIVPYIDLHFQTNYERCFIVINPIAVSDEEISSIHGGDLSANQIDIGTNIPGCAIEDLHSYIRRRRRLDEKEALCLFIQICETVRLCHRNGIILRDLKLKRFFFIDEER